MKRVVVVGGGISGLAAAHRLAELNRERRLNLAVTLLEAGDRFGGVIETERRDGFVLEGGPDAFLSGKPWAVELCRRIGLSEEMIKTRPDFRRLFVLRGERMVEFEQCEEELRQELGRRVYGMESGFPRYDLFVTPRDGMGRLVERLIERMPDVDRRTGAPAKSIRSERVEGRTEWNILLENGESLKADALCLALPSVAVASLLQPFAPQAAAALEKIPCASVASVNLGFREEDLPKLPEGFGYMVPAKEVRMILGCNFSSMKFPGRAPEGAFLLRAFVGGPFHPEAVDREEKELVEAVRQELRLHLGLNAEPRLVWVRRYRNAIPLPSAGRLTLAPWPGLALIGNAYHGVGIPDCVHSAEAAAERIAGEV